MPLLAFQCEPGSTGQFAKSMVVVALHWSGVRILENEYVANQARHLHCWLVTDSVI